MKLLLLGGTTEAYALARALADRPGLQVITSLAGRTTAPRLPDGDVRIGGFGGPAGLERYLRDQGTGAVIDVTHPFAATMGRNAAVACAAAGVPLLRLERPAWQPGPGDDWYSVADWPAAVERLRQGASRVLLAVGRQDLDAFAGLDQVWFLIRSVDRPEPMPALGAELLLARGPFDLAGERALLQERRIDTIVCKNSGGSASAAKLEAARELGIRVVMRQRPPRPPVTTVPDVAGAVGWVESMLDQSAG